MNDKACQPYSMIMLHWMTDVRKILPERYYECRILHQNGAGFDIEGGHGSDCTGTSMVSSCT